MIRWVLISALFALVAGVAAHAAGQRDWWVAALIAGIAGPLILALEFPRSKGPEDDD